jgi:hypothetical protein
MGAEIEHPGSLRSSVVNGPQRSHGAPAEEQGRPIAFLVALRDAEVDPASAIWPGLHVGPCEGGGLGPAEEAVPHQGTQGDVGLAPPECLCGRLVAPEAPPPGRGGHAGQQVLELLVVLGGPPDLGEVDGAQVAALVFQEGLFTAVVQMEALSVEYGHAAVARLVHGDVVDVGLAGWLQSFEGGQVLVIGAVLGVP